MVSVDPVDILLVNDNAYDVELTLRALERHHLANKVVVGRRHQTIVLHAIGDDVESLSHRMRPNSKNRSDYQTVTVGF